MKSRTNLILGIIITLLLSLGAYWYWQNRYNRFNWIEHYEDNKDPYGTHIIKNLLKDYYADYGFIDLSDTERTQLSPWKGDSLSNYFLLTLDFNPDTLNIQEMVDYVARGNNAFISTTYLGERFKDSLLSQHSDCLYLDFISHLDTMATFSFTHPALSKDTLLSTYQIGNKKELYNWRSFSISTDCDYSPIYTLGKQNGLDSNFIQIPYGQGNFYLHSTPILFANIQLLNETNRNYLEGVLAHFPKRKTYWDTKNRLLSDNADNENFPRADPNVPKGALSYLLSQRPLKWAWYVLVSLTLAFLVFRSRRKQRIIPVLAKNENTSLAFIHTIGNLYFQQGNHKAICEKKVLHFLSFIRNRYHLNTSKIEETFIHQLHLKSEIPEVFLNKLFNFYNNISSSDFVSENTLVEFHSMIQHFHQNCK